MISVIVPVYNVESCLGKCLDSILEQTYRDFELLLIDDGATDSSGDICERYAKTDERIKVFHKPNGGLSDARNYGIERASGDYLTFIDSDDYIIANYLEVLYKMATENNAEISAVSCEEVYDMDAPTAPVKCGKVNVIDAEETMRRMLIRSPFGVSAWAKLYKRELFAELRYPVGRLYEDMLTTPYVVAKCSKIAYTDTKMYMYYQRSGSITNKPVSERDLQAFSGLEQIAGFMDKNYPSVHEAMESRYIDDTLNLIFHRAVWQDDYLKYANEIRKRDRDKWAKGLKNPYVSKGRKIQLLMLLISPKLYRIVYRLKAKGENKNI